MNLASIIVLLQLALSLLASPGLASNPTLQSQANAFAAQAMAIASQALTQPPETQLGSVPTSTISIPDVSSSTQNIQITVTPPVQAPMSDQAVLGSDAPSGPTQITWSGPNSMGVQLQFGFNVTDAAVGINATSTIFHLASNVSNWDSATLTINGITYDLPITHKGRGINNDIEFGVQGLQSGQDYPYTIQVNSGNNFAIDSDTISLP